jgi:hypothetical protein
MTFTAPPNVSPPPGVLRADRNLGEFDITGDVKFTKNRLDTPLARSRIVVPGGNRRICLDRGLDTTVDRGTGLHRFDPVGVPE